MLTNKPNKDLEIYTALWIGAKDFETGAIENRGFWNNIEHRNVTFQGQQRIYYGIGEALQVGPIAYSKGSEIQTQKVEIGPLRPEVQSFIKGFDMRLAKAQLISITIDPETGAMTQEILIDGEVDVVQEEEAESDEDGNTQIGYSATIVSNARLGTRTLTLKKSEASQRTAFPNDRGRRYSDISGDVKVVWMGDTNDPHKTPVADRRQL